MAVLRMADGKVQALDLELVEALESALDAVDRDDRAAVVLTGTGASFSAGVDLFPSAIVIANANEVPVQVTLTDATGAVTDTAQPVSMAKRPLVASTSPSTSAIWIW